MFTAPPFSIRVSFLVLTSAFLLPLIACESASKREIASLKEGASVASTDVLSGGILVNPVKFTLAPKWKVQLHDGRKNNWAVGDLKLTAYELGEPKGLNDFQLRIQELQDLDLVEAERKGKKEKGFFTKGARRALVEIQNLILSLNSGTLKNEERSHALQAIAELTASFNYNFKYPLDNKVWIGLLPIRVLDELSNPSMSDKAEPSINVATLDSKDDLSTVNPPNSSFWHSPGEISKKNLYYGFDRSKLLTLNDVCSYKEPKDGYGASGGLELICAGSTVKVKFGDEMSSEPFNARLIWALGFNAIPVDHARGIKVRYNRNILKEYNSRESLDIDVKSIFGFKYFSIHINGYLDPITDAIAGARLKDGTFITSEHLRKQLLRVTKKKAEEKDENYNSDFEAKIDYLFLKPAAVETKLNEETLQNVGPWSWDGLDHQKRREARAFGTLAAFLNLYDARLDNNKLRVSTDSAGKKSLLHFVSDVGSGLGNASGPLANHDGVVDEFPWEFIAKRSDRAPISSTNRTRPTVWQSPFVMRGYNVIQENKSFRQTQLADARWLARKLAQVTEAQFQDMMIAAGFSAAEVKLGVAKLLSRRENLIDVLGLRDEIPPLRSEKIDRRFNYDPRVDPLPHVEGRIDIVPPIENQLITKGRLQSF